MMNNYCTDPWHLLSDEQRAMLCTLARRLGFQTLETQGTDRLDFQEVAVWTLRDALAQAYMAGTKPPPPQ